MDFRLNSKYFTSSDKKLSDLGLERSKLFIGVGRDCPRIALPILDLIENDPEWSKSKFEMHTLLKNALEADSTIKSQFHPYFTQNQDIVEGLQNYQSWHYLGFFDFFHNENLLLNLLSNFLQRKIIFHKILNSFIPQPNRSIFGEHFKTEFNILGYRFGSNNFYISAKIKEFKPLALD